MSEQLSRESIIDRSVLDTLRSHALSAAFLLQVIEIFIEHAEVSYLELVRAGSFEDRETISRVAHRLKGSCLNVGANYLVKLLRNLETFRDSNVPMTNWNDQMFKLRTGLDHSYKALKSIL